MAHPDTRSPGEGQWHRFGCRPQPQGQRVVGTAAPRAGGLGTCRPSGVALGARSPHPALAWLGPSASHSGGLLGPGGRGVMVKGTPPPPASQQQEGSSRGRLLLPCGHSRQGQAGLGLDQGSGHLKLRPRPTGERATLCWWVHDRNHKGRSPPPRTALARSLEQGPAPSAHSLLLRGWRSPQPARLCVGGDCLRKKELDFWNMEVLGRSGGCREHEGRGTGSICSGAACT